MLYGRKDPQQEKEVAFCEECDGELYKGEAVVVYDGTYFCDRECFHEHLEDDIVIEML